MDEPPLQDPNAQVPGLDPPGPDLRVLNLNRRVDEYWFSRFNNVLVVAGYVRDLHRLFSDRITPLCSLCALCDSLI